MKTLIIFLLSRTLGFTQSPNDLVGKDSINHALLSSLMIEIVNVERSNRGILMLEIDQEAMEFAKHHATWMTQNQFKHSNGKYSECISDGFVASMLTYNEAANAAISTWKNSPQHWKILMDPYYTKCGTYSAEHKGSGLVYGFSVMRVFSLSK